VIDEELGEQLTQSGIVVDDDDPRTFRSDAVGCVRIVAVGNAGNGGRISARE